MNVSVTRSFHKKMGAKRGFREERPYDYLYDPTFTVSDRSDYIRAGWRARGSADQMMQLSQTLMNATTSGQDGGPAALQLRWMMAKAQSHQPYPVDVTGVDRWKFFKRPHIPFSQQIPPDVVFAMPRADHLSLKLVERAESPFERTVGVQTDYRESEAQTDPYTPEYTLRPGAPLPELLTLATLSWGRGLPAGLDEVEMIERARIKRAWEATLPPLSEVTHLDKRRRKMEEMERKEWAFREQEIEKLQETRLVLLKQYLEKRHTQQEELSMDRLNKYFIQLQSRKEERVRLIRKNFAAALRNIEVKWQSVEGKPKKRDIVKDHTDYASQMYAPQSCRGVFPDRSSERNVVRSSYLSTYQGLQELESGLPASILKPRIKAPKMRSGMGTATSSDRKEMELVRLHQALKAASVKFEEERQLRLLTEVEKPVTRPTTPVVDAPPEEEEEKERAAICLQKLLRGRSIQKQMLEGRNRHMELICEMATTHALQQEQQELQRADEQVTLALQRQQQLHDSRMSQIESYVAGLSGSVVVNMLDFLAKELVRLQDERRIHAFVLVAERDRRLREAEESGRRQAEERRRREEDEIFKQVVKVHQATVDLYLEDIILSSIDQTADDQAREAIHQMAQEVNDIAYAVEEKRTRAQSEEIVAQLVYGFLIPEVQKITVRERVKQSQKRHLRATRSLIHGTRVPSASDPALRSRDPSDMASSALLSEMLDRVENTVSSSFSSDEL